MLFKFIFPLFFLFMAIALEGASGTRNGRSPRSLKLREKSIPMPRPAPGKPLTVKISAEISSASIDSDEHEFEASFLFKQEWTDPRLAFESEDEGKFRLITNVESIWTPDLFFVENTLNETYGKDVCSIKNFPDGRIITEERKTVKTSCSLYLKNYPFDTQTCPLQIESYGYTVDDINIEWNNNKNKAAVTERLLTHDFETSIKSGTGTAVYRGVQYSSPWMLFTFNRTPVAIIFRVILPIVVITFCSWTSYFFTRNDIGVRLSLCISPIMIYLLQINFCAAFFISPIYLAGLDIWAGTAFLTMTVSGIECVYLMCSKDPDEGSPEGAVKNTYFKDRVAVALFITGLDLISVSSVFLCRFI